MDSALNSYVTTKIATLITNITPLVTLGVGLYITVFGYMVLSGKVQKPFEDFMMKSIKIVLITAIALNGENYSQYVIGSIKGLQTGLASSLGVTGSDPFEQLDHTLGTGFGLVWAYLQKISSLGWTQLVQAIQYLLAAGIAMWGILCVVLSGAYLALISDIFLKILLAVGPLFTSCLLWPPFARFFDSWFSQVMSYVLKSVLVTITLGFVIKIYQVQFNQITIGDGADQQNFFVVVMQICVIGYMLYRVMLEVNNVAAGLAGGMAASSMSVGQIFNAMKSPFAAAKQTAQGVSSAAKTAKNWMPSWKRNAIKGVSS